MEFGITLSSLAAQKVDSYNKPENFTTRFDQPIVLDQNEKYIVGLHSGIMHYSWHNISMKHNNNKIEYKSSVDEPFREITLRPGMYDYSDIESYIDRWLLREGVITKKDLKRRIDDKPPIALEFNLATYRCSLDLDSGYSIRLIKNSGI